MKIRMKVTSYLWNFLCIRTARRILKKPSDSFKGTKISTDGQRNTYLNNMACIGYTNPIIFIKKLLYQLYEMWIIDNTQTIPNLLQAYKLNIFRLPIKTKTAWFMDEIAHKFSKTAATSGDWWVEMNKV